MAFDRITAATTDVERFARLRLARTARIGPVNFAQLLIRFGSAQRALAALPDLARRSGGGFIAAPADKVEAEMVRGQAAGARLMTLGDGDYPGLLAQADAAPPILWSLGPGLPVRRRAVAIVGARNASAAGQKMAYLLAKELGEAGFTIISGLARGIDARAHEASLATGTVAVLGGGVDYVYPPANAGLYERIKSGGLILSESPPGYTARAQDFPRRNRIISGRSLATIVVEAELRSGSLITARLAAEQNREVFAVPGSPLDPRSKGCNDLLRHGANLCEHAEDVIRALENQMGFDAPPIRYRADFPEIPVSFSGRDIENDISQAGKVLLGLISPTPTSREDLLRLSGFAPFVALAALSELEIAGLIEAGDGGAYVRG